MPVDVLYVAWNRLAFTVESFTALAENTDWTQVRTLFVHDDDSTDGTNEWLADATDKLAHARIVQDVIFSDHRVGGPVASMNWYLDHPLSGRDKADVFAKIDNDFVVCPGWLPEMLRVHEETGVDILGTEPMVGDVTAPPFDGRDAQEAVHIGGKGLIRRSAFKYCRATPGGWNGYQGFTQWQHNHPEVSKAWITPDLPCFGLDQLPHEPWRGLAEEYVRKQWQRPWSKYAEASHDYWDWWTPVLERAEVA